jgi:hypothetical protein
MTLPPTPPFDKQECNLDRCWWNVPRLTKLAEPLPLLSLPLDAMNLACTEYTTNMRTFVAHMNNVLTADLDIPILLSEDGEIFDGRHRIMKALHLGLTHIKAKRFETNPEPDRIDA